MTTEPRAQEIQERLDKATPGPWEAVEVARSVYGTPIHSPIGTGARMDEGAHIANAFSDAEFIAHAPEDIAWLLARVAELEALETAELDVRNCCREIKLGLMAERDALRAANGRLRQTLAQIQRLSTHAWTRATAAAALALDDAPQGGTE
jgi:hypothetical protein